MRSETTKDSLAVLLKDLKLPAFLAYFEDVSKQAENQGWSFQQYLHHLAEQELTERQQRKVERLTKQSGLPREKTLATLDLARFPAKIQRQVPSLCDGGFLERAENVLAFGLPGRGKTHLVCAVGHALVQRGYRVFFQPTYRLVQRLLVAKRDLLLEKELRRLDRYDVIIMDDIGYVQQEREEMEVLFTFLGERYERRSVIITSNLVFSQWDRIFKDSMTTAAAIDRVVHHAVILEIPGASYRSEEAQKRNKVEAQTMEVQAENGRA